MYSGCVFLELRYEAYSVGLETETESIDGSLHCNFSVHVLCTHRLGGVRGRLKNICPMFNNIQNAINRFLLQKACLNR